MQRVLACVLAGLLLATSAAAQQPTAGGLADALQKK
jgi:hypothetical protein